MEAHQACLRLLSPPQGALASEDLDWGEPQTALWAIAREHDIVSDLVTEASAAVEQAVEEAKQKARATADAKFAEWLAPVEQLAAEKGVDLQATGCLDSGPNKFGDVFYTINVSIVEHSEAIILCEFRSVRTQRALQIYKYRDYGCKPLSSMRNAGQHPYHSNSLDKILSIERIISLVIRMLSSLCNGCFLCHCNTVGLGPLS